MIITAVLALGITGLIFSLLLSFLSRKLKVEEDPKAEAILNILPGLNCGACGFSGCRAYALAVVKQNSLFSGCLPGGAELNEKIKKELGLEGAVSIDSKKAVLRCGASDKEKKQSSSYKGPQTCKAADITGGAIDCIWGCIGFGDCVSICPVGAISLDGKKINIDVKKCVGCGKCLKACPRGLFELVSLKETGIYYVACSNKEKALEVKKACGRGCIGCSLCTRVKDSPYYIKENLSYVDYAKAKDKSSLEEGKNKCPTKCIFFCA